MLWLFLFSFGLSGLLFVALHGSQYIGKDYFESDEFNSEIYQFTSLLYSFEVGPSLKEEMKKTITVSDEDIEEHRYRYGDLNEQLANTKDQYELKITDAKAAKNKEAVEMYTAERDKKLKDITRNFTSDDYVKTKIIKEVEQKMNNYFRDLEKNDRGTYNSYEKLFTYVLTDLKSGKEYRNSANDIDEKKMIFIRNYPFDGEYLNTGSSFSYDEYGDIANQLNSMMDTKLQGKIAIAKTSPVSHPIMIQYRDYQVKQEMIYTYSVLSLLAFLISLYLYKQAKIGQQVLTGNWITIYHQIPSDVRLGVLIGTGFVLLAQLAVFIGQLPYFNLEDIYFIRNVVVYLGSMSILTGLTFIQARDFFQVIRSHPREEWEKSLTYKMYHSFKQFFLNRSVGFQVIALLMVIFLAGVGLAGVILQPVLLLIYFPLVVVIGIPAFLYVIKQIGSFNVIVANTDEWAKGNLESELPTTGKSVMAQLARNINTLKYGVKTSQKVAVKSERLKTELITNVSHDLRTPLTSIMTYTELLKTADLSEENREAYIEIIDRKSKRLKVLIDDLFEVSKMASGNMELVKEQADIVQLLQQSLAEHDEAIQHSDLQFRVTNLEKPIYAVVDGQKLWRVFDNLIGNILKYALVNTRVYISIVDDSEQVVISFKNVTKYELSENIDELFERFKRGDASRQTEGSGLGLAIAKSIVDLHDGQLHIEVDGDLFKVTVRLQK